MTPWTDYSGKFSPLKAAVFAGLFLPALWIAYQALTGFPGSGRATSLLGARPITEAIHQSGDWAIRFLMLSLAVTPLRRIAQWPKLINVRRMLGVAAMCYALLHVVLYAADQKWNLAFVASEIALRIYLTIGFLALLGLIALGATSTDAAIRRLKGNWNRLHRAVYAIGVLAALHYFMQSKADVYQATLIAGFFVMLMFFRIAHWRGFALSSPVTVASIAVLSALATAGLEYAWYALATGVPPLRVLAANLQFSFSIRPAWWVLAAGLGAAAVALARPYLPGRARPSPRSRPARAAVYSNVRPD